MCLFIGVSFPPSCNTDSIRSTACLYRSAVCYVRYSTPQDISRARQSFFSGSVPFLVITERFHFFRRCTTRLPFILTPPTNTHRCSFPRRYKIRGIRNIIFYGPPDHAQFYAEFLGFPFLDTGVHPSDVTVRMLHSKYDMLRLERIVGTDDVGGLIES